jgi:CubicO group peptidase (beta-lactamase class C family)
MPSSRTLPGTTWTTTPCDINPAYGLFWWINHKHALSSIADETAFAARGAGRHTIFIWPEREIVIVLRWCSAPKDAVDNILSALG